MEVINSFLWCSLETLKGQITNLEEVTINILQIVTSVWHRSIASVSLSYFNVIMQDLCNMNIDPSLNVAEICIDLHTMFSFQNKFSMENSAMVFFRSIKVCCLNKSAGLDASYFICNIKMKKSISIVAIIINLLFPWKNL